MSFGFTGPSGAVTPASDSFTLASGSMLAGLARMPLPAAGGGAFVCDVGGALVPAAACGALEVLLGVVAAGAPGFEHARAVVIHKANVAD